MTFDLTNVDFGLDRRDPPEYGEPPLCDNGCDLPAEGERGLCIECLKEEEE